jgi:hypothetical protein
MSDVIKTRIATDEYRKGWDATFSQSEQENFAKVPVIEAESDRCLDCQRNELKCFRCRMDR